MNLLNWKFKYYKGGFILYRKFLTKRNNKVQIKMIYMMNLLTYLITDESYTLNSENTLKSLVIDYKKTIDGLNDQTKLK